MWSTIFIQNNLNFIIGNIKCEWPRLRGLLSSIKYFILKKWNHYESMQYLKIAFFFYQNIKQRRQATLSSTPVYLASISIDCYLKPWQIMVYVLINTFNIHSYILSFPLFSDLGINISIKLLAFLSRTVNANARFPPAFYINIFRNFCQILKNKFIY